MPKTSEEQRKIISEYSKQYKGSNKKLDKKEE